MENTWKVVYKMLQVISAGLDHEVEIWLIPINNKLQDVQEEVKKKCFYFYKLKPFIKEYLMTMDKAIRNSINLIENSESWKN